MFYAASVPDESVLGMTSDEDNKQLITGDTKGHVTVWNIEEHCIKPTEKVGLQLVSPKTGIFSPAQKELEQIMMQMGKNYKH